MLRSNERSNRDRIPFMETITRTEAIAGPERSCPACGAACEPSGESLAGHSLFLCRSCGLRSALTAFGLPVSYDDAYASGLYPDQTLAQMQRAKDAGADAATLDTYIPFFRRMTPANGHDRLLDIGCGGGRFCRAAARCGWKTLGIDLSEVALQFARGVSPLNYRAIDLADVPQHCGRFDVVTAFEVLEHQANIRLFLDQVRPVLETDGRFFCTVPAWEHPEVRGATRPDWVPPFHLLFFTRRSLRATLERSGFDVLETGYIPMGPSGLVRRMKWTAWRWAKRARGDPQHPLGIWALARTTSPSHAQ